MLEPSERGKAWLEAGGARAKKLAGPNAYLSLVYELHLQHEDEKTNEEVFDENITVINNDVPRSFGALLSKFDSKETRRDLTEVLMVFNHYKPQSYTQGMNFIVAVALAHMPKEDSFWLLVDLVETLPEGFFQRTALDEVELFVEIVSNYAPIIREHLEEGNDLESFQRAMGYLLVQWMVPLFVHVLPLDTLLRVWDFLFSEKKKKDSNLILSIHRIAFALLEVHSGPLLSKHRQIGEALSCPNQSHNPEHFSELTIGLESTSGIEFIQRILSAAARDTNYNRIVRLAKEVTIEPSWLHQIREEKNIERSSLVDEQTSLGSSTSGSGSAVQLTEIRNERVVVDTPSSFDDFAANFFGCVGVRDNSIDKQQMEDVKQAKAGAEEEDCVIS